ncbi:TPA: hypothetical protein ACN1ND_002425 [Enterococcus faecalis]
MKKNKNLLLVATLMGVVSISGVASQEVKANEVESSADVTLSQGIRLTEVPNFDFGTVIYNGDVTSSALSGANLGDKKISWFDGTPTKEQAKIYASISDIPQEGLSEATLELYIGYSNSVPKVNGTEVESNSWFLGGKKIITFNQDKNLIINTKNVPSNIRSGYSYMKETNNDFSAGSITRKTINLPAGLQSENMTMTVNWDIESSPE